MSPAPAVRPTGIFPGVPAGQSTTAPGYLATATAVVVLFNLLFSLWIAYRLRLTLASLAALLTHTPPLHARTLHPFLIASLPPSTPLPSLPSLYSVLPPDFSTYVLVFLVFVYVGHRLWHCRAPRFGSGPSFDIFLEVKASGKCVFIKLQTVTDCPAEYLVTGSFFVLTFVFPVGCALSDVVALWLRRLLSTGGSWVRLPL